MESTADEFARDGDMVTLVVLAKLKKGLMVSSAMLICITTWCSKIALPHLRSYCGEAVDSIISICTQLHRSDCNLELEFE